MLLISSRIADRKRKVTDAERELLMFGEEYARESVLMSRIDAK
jgi:hypothetical protein